MTNTSIYQNIAQRTGGNIYIGVVGPVRTGKSTFIKRLAESLLIPNIDDPYMRERARDELPQSGSGRTIMTAEPKFIPEDAVRINIGGAAEMSVRIIDCVGYMVDGAVGDMEGDSQRMVATPWFDHEVSMRQAAETGTRKVIGEHSTIGVVVTTDGSVSGIPRASYAEAERRIITELRAIGKPFVVVVNSAQPGSEAVQELVRQIESDYGVTALAMNCLEMGEEEAVQVLHGVLMEFPMSRMGLYMPDWLTALGWEHPLSQKLLGNIRACADGMYCMRDAEYFTAALSACEEVEEATEELIDPGVGDLTVRVRMPRGLFYSAISADTGLEISNDADLAALLHEFAAVRRDYSKAVEAINEARSSGYGVILPDREEVVLNEPDIVKRGGRYGVKLRANAPAIHLIKTEVETEVSPAVKGEGSSEELLQRLLEEFEGDPGRIWETNMFGKALSQIAEEGLTAKIRRLPPEICSKLGGTLAKTINEGGNGIICLVF